MRRLLTHDFERKIPASGFKIKKLVNWMIRKITLKTINPITAETVFKDFCLPSKTSYEAAVMLTRRINEIMGNYD